VDTERKVKKTATTGAVNRWRFMGSLLSGM